MTLKTIGHAKADPVISTQGHGRRAPGPAESIEWLTPVSLAPVPYAKCGESSGYPATNAIDGSVETYWFHYVFCYHWIAFDLGVTRTVSKIRLYQGAAWFGASLPISVFVSDDPANWGTAVWVGSMSGYYWIESGVFSKAGRYVKIVSGSNSKLQAPAEFQVGLLVEGAGGPNPGLAQSASPSMVGLAAQGIIAPASGKQKFE